MLEDAGVDAEEDAVDVALVGFDGVVVGGSFSDCAHDAAAAAGNADAHAAHAAALATSLPTASVGRRLGTERGRDGECGEEEQCGKAGCVSAWHGEGEPQEAGFDDAMQIDA